MILLFAVDPNAAKALLQKGLLALQHGQLAEAQSALEQASRLGAENPYVWTSLAETYLREGDFDQAETAAAKAGHIGGTSPVVSHALSLFYFNDAQARLRKQDFTRAGEVLTTGLENDPRNVQLILALGVARYGQRRFEEAIANFLRVIELDPSFEQPYVFLGKMLDQAGAKLGEITKDYDAWNTQQPDNPQAPLVLAKALLAADSHSARAADLLKRSIALEPNSWEAHYELGVLLAGQHKYADAAAELKKSIDLNAKEAMPHYHLARVYDRLGDPEAAKAERAIHQQLTGTGVQ